ncbi:ABC transporter substrate-binding protein [Sulfitobacter algicola]|uniref:ABC transporter substrate-binding protein n=1 Tax=Parasulfitobacter algicola TaxID=2614809 RepID=A0ABX2IZM8_9RHOB|nr:ABC transporter substrate-binding protein [Sulfitobacter algicola]
MIITFLIVFWGAGTALWVSSSAAQQVDSNADVLSIGGSVTEIIYALDQQHRLVARDTTSVFPPDATRLPDVGYMRALSAEGVLSVGPAMIIAEEGAGPPETIELLQAASIPFIEIPDAYNLEGIVAKIHAVGAALDVEDKAQALADQVATDFAQAEARANDYDGMPKKVLFILSTQGGRILASGTGTAADGIIRMAGAVNAVTAFEGYKPMTDEAISAAAPDVILMMDRTGDHNVPDSELFAMPAIIPTPAAENRAIIRMNGLYLLGFGPRTSEAILDLNLAIYGG